MAASVWLSLIRATWGDVLTDTHNDGYSTYRTHSSETETTTAAAGATSDHGHSTTDAEQQRSVSASSVIPSQSSAAITATRSQTTAATTKLTRRFHAQENKVRELRTSLSVLRPSATLAVCYLSCLWLREPLLCNDIILYASVCCFVAVVSAFVSLLLKHRRVSGGHGMAACLIWIFVTLHCVS